MNEIRKASDIILSLEEKINKLQAQNVLYDKTLKMILDQSNKIISLFEILSETNIFNDEQKQSIKNKIYLNNREAIQLTSPPKIDVETSFDGTRRISRGSEKDNKATNADITFQEYLEKRHKEKNAQPLPETDKKNNSKPLNINEKKIPVVQRVQDNNKKDLFMAEVNIFSESGEQILKAKTNAMGKWQGQLFPGRYKIKITKMDTATQKKIEGEQHIIVSNTDSSLILNNFIINR